MPFRRLPRVVVTKHTILDNGIWPAEKELCELGMREGWLILYKIIETKHSCEYQYRYPEGYKI